MGLFGSIFGKKETQSVPQAATETMEPVNAEVATGKLNLRKETLKISLEKKSMQNVKARVALILDKSGSMQDEYRNGTVQSIVERLLPIGLKFDDNAELDVWVFSDGFKRFRSIKEADFRDYVNREIVRNYGWGGTNYAPIINDIVKKYVVEEPSSVPTLVIFLTDGENSDHEASERAIIKASYYNIFFQFVGIGYADFKFLKRLDTMEGRAIDNANFFEIKNINSMTDANLYDLLLTEYPLWEKLIKGK